MGCKYSTSTSAILLAMELDIFNTFKGAISREIVSTASRPDCCLLDAEGASWTTPEKPLMSAIAFELTFEQAETSINEEE